MLDQRAELPAGTQLVKKWTKSHLGAARQTPFALKDKNQKKELARRGDRGRALASCDAGRLRAEPSLCARKDLVPRRLPRSLVAALCRDGAVVPI